MPVTMSSVSPPANAARSGLAPCALKGSTATQKPSSARAVPESVREWAAEVGDGVTAWLEAGDRKSTRLNSSHLGISYAVFCLKKGCDQDAPRRGEQHRHVALERRALQCAA